MTATEMPPPLFKRFHLRLLVDRFDECFRFYRDVLGLGVRYGDENAAYAEFKTAGVHLALFGRQAMAAAVGQPVRTRPSHHCGDAVIVLRVDDVDATVNRIQKRGGKVMVPATDRPDWGCRTAHLRDPEGNLIEINGDFEQATKSVDSG